MSLEVSLRAMARERGIALKDVADAAGISRATLYRIFRQTQNPRVDTLRKIAAVFGVECVLARNDKPVFREGAVDYNFKLLTDTCSELKGDSLLRVLWYARYELDSERKGEK